MNRAKLGRLGVGRVAVVACAGALGVAGCGGSSSSSSSTSTSGSPATASAAAARFEPVLLQLDVNGDAYTSAVYGGQANLAAERAVIGKERDTVYNADLAVRRLSAPPSAQRALVTYLTQSGNVVAALDRLYKQPSMQAIQTGLSSSVSPRITRFLDAEKQLRTTLGLPKSDPWLGPQPIGPTIYADRLSAPGSKVKWPLGFGMRFAGGGLEIPAPAGHNGVTGPTTPYSFDGQHITVQVDESTAKGDPYIGILCPAMKNASDSGLIGQIGPGAQWSIGVFHINRNGYLMRAPASTKAIHVGQTNHLRVDCDQWHPGMTTVRVYVNGQFMGASSGAFTLDPTKEPGVAVISPKTASLVKFTNWQVSKLGH